MQVETSNYLHGSPTAGGLTREYSVLKFWNLCYLAQMLITETSFIFDKASVSMFE